VIHATLFSVLIRQDFPGIFATCFSLFFKNLCNTGRLPSGKLAAYQPSQGSFARKPGCVLLLQSLLSSSELNSNYLSDALCYMWAAVKKLPPNNASFLHLLPCFCLLGKKKTNPNQNLNPNQQTLSSIPAHRRRESPEAEFAFRRSNTKPPVAARMFNLRGSSICTCLGAAFRGSAPYHTLLPLPRCSKARLHHEIILLLAQFYRSLNPFFMLP